MPCGLLHILAPDLSQQILNFFEMESCLSLRSVPSGSLALSIGRYFLLLQLQVLLLQFQLRGLPQLKPVARSLLLLGSRVWTTPPPPSTSTASESNSQQQPGYHLRSLGCPSCTTTGDPDECGEVETGEIESDLSDDEMMRPTCMWRHCEGTASLTASST